MMLCNDSLHEIKDDKEFGRKVYDAVSRVRNTTHVDISSGCHVNAATVIGCEHADCTQIVAVGGNYGKVLKRIWYKNYYKPEDEIALIKQLADEYGFRLVKKSIKKG